MMTLPEPLGDVGPLRVSDFLRLDAAGRFEGRGRTELLAGKVHVRSAQHRPHGRATMRLYDALREALVGRELTVMVGTSVALSDHDAPAPDLTLTAAPGGDGLIPGSAVSLVIEVADATLANDLGDKAALYATAGIPEYWTADINARVLHQLWSPIDGAFAERREVPFGQPVTSATIADLTIATDRL